MHLPSSISDFPVAFTVNRGGVSEKRFTISEKRFGLLEKRFTIS